jgi:uncharacterized protein with GYD domain
MALTLPSSVHPLGSYDFVNIVEAPSNEVIARTSVELASRG